MVKLTYRQRSRIDSLIDRSSDGCWPWLGATLPNGYGRIKVGPKHWLAHRLSFARYVAPLNYDCFVCHRCDNPICVNPAHLFQGTALTNGYDMSAKLRSSSPLTERDLIAIYGLRKAGETYARISELFGVSQTAIGSIVRGDTFQFHFEKHHPELFDMAIE